MDINELLCVGRSRKAHRAVETSNKTLSRAGLYIDEHSYNSEDSGKGRDFTSADYDEDYKTLDMYSSGYLTPHKKSILRGNPVSPRYGSLSPNSRSVRFSDKEEEDEALFAKIHVNETTQTSHSHVNKTHHHHHHQHHHTSSKPAESRLSRFEADLKMSANSSQEIKTSTPRQWKSSDISPHGRQLSPHRSRDENQPKMLSTSPKASEQKHHKEKIVIDIDITPKHVSKSTPVSYERGRQKSGLSNIIDGRKIIQNMSVNDGLKPLGKPGMPDGRKITQNMDLHQLSFNSAGTQTLSEASSPRSASPETPYSQRRFPDGRKIIQNMELGVHDVIKMKSESVQTDLEPRIKSAGVQTIDEPTDDELNEQYRSVSLQANLDLSDTSLEGEGTRSIAIQTQDHIDEEIPDGTKITKNMPIFKQTKADVRTTSSEDTKRQQPSLNDSNWNEFVKHLDLFNPSPCSSESESDEDDEMPTNLREPVIVYDSHRHASPVKVDGGSEKHEMSHSSTIEHRQGRGAKKLLESEEFKRRQYESVLKDNGLLKYSNQLQPRACVPKSKMDKTIDKSMQTAPVANKATSTERRPTKCVATKPLTTSYQPETDTSQPKTSMQTYVNDERLEDSDDDENYPETFSHQRRHSNDSLSFTPIETYSFNPDTHTKATTSEDKSKDIDIPVAKHESGSSVGANVKESITKNSFIRGVDLGPIPSTKPDVSSTYGSNLYGRFSSSSSSRLVPEKRYMKPTASSLASARSYCFTPSAKENSRSYVPVAKHSDNKYLSQSSRPSTAPGIRTKGSPLSSSLREIRNSAVRKSAMSSVLGHKDNSPVDYGRGKHLSTNKWNSCNTESSSQRLGKGYKSYEDYDPYTLSGSKSKASVIPNFSKNPTPEDYMVALNDISNARLERSRSRSKSPRYDPIQLSYDYKKNKAQDSSDGGKDEGFIESVSSMTGHAHIRHSPTSSPDRRSIHPVKQTQSYSDSHSRGLSRKPPLPTKSRVRDPSNDRSTSRTNAGVDKGVSVQTDDGAKERSIRPRNTSSVTKDKPARNASTERSAPDSRFDDVRNDTIKIGSVPSSVIDKAAMFLGHQTIQKIINEAKL